MSECFTKCSHPALGVVEQHHFDAVIVGVHPVQHALLDVQTQTVGPQHVFGGDEDAGVGAVHPRLPYAAAIGVSRVLLPVAPVHHPETQHVQHD